MPQGKSSPITWPLYPVLVLCLPGDCFGLLWFIYQFVNEGSIAHSQLYDVLIYFVALMVCAAKNDSGMHNSARVCNDCISEDIVDGAEV
jgi:hypothetical protein